MRRANKMQEEGSLREENRQFYAGRAKQLRLREQLFARLASIPSLEALKAGEKLGLVKKANQAGIRSSLFDKFAATLRSKDGKAEKAWGRAGITPYAWVALWETYPWAHSLIRDLLDGKEVSLQPVTQDTVLKLRFPKSRIAHVTSYKKDRVSAGDELIDDLVLTLRQCPFPYRCCPVCQTIVFIPVRRQKYCSRDCTARGSEAARKGKRREYMKKYMADRRKRAKKLAAARQRAT